jgi:hypothetical protein
MTDELPFTSPHVNPPPPQQPTAGEHIWALKKEAKHLVCELRDHGADGCEAQMVRDGEFFAGRRFADRTHALAHAEAIRALLEGGGWVTLARVEQDRNHYTLPPISKDIE